MFKKKKHTGFCVKIQFYFICHSLMQTMGDNKDDWKNNGWGEEVVNDKNVWFVGQISEFPSINSPSLSVLLLATTLQYVGLKVTCSVRMTELTNLLH